MKAQAIILAGGYGTRLRPLTEHIPKPLAPVLGKSVYMHILDLLAKHGVSEAAAAVAYKAEMISALTHDKVNVRYFTEDKPLGTAGCVKNAADALADTFIVISGDAICDFDLSSALKQHKKLGARATILLSHVKSPLEYGGVLTEGGFVKRFVEKPAWRQTLTDTVSSGIYILEKSLLDMVPKGEPFDFARDVFAHMMRTGEKIAAICCEGYWCDIGDLAAYYRCCFDALKGKIKLQGKQSTVAWDFDGENAKVSRSIIHSGVSAGGGTIIEGAIICEGCKIGRGCVIGEGCVIGAYVEIGDGVVLSPGTVVESKKKIKSGGHMFYGGESKNISEGRISGKLSAIDCSFCLRLGRAIAAAEQSGDKACNIGLLIAGEGTLLGEAFCCGVREAGGDCTILGNTTDNFVGFAALAVTKANLDGAVHIEVYGDIVSITILDRKGLPPERTAERKLVAKFLEDNTLSQKAAAGKKAVFDSKASYIDTINKICGDLSGSEFVVSASTSDFFRQALKSCGAAITEGEGGIDIKIDFSGHTMLNFYGLDFWHSAAAAIAYLTVYENQHQFALPYVSPDKISGLATVVGAAILYYSPSPSDKTDSDARKLASQQPWLRDSFLLCAVLCKATAALGVPPTELANQLFFGDELNFSAAESEFEHDSDLIAERMRKLCESEANPTMDGARLDFADGSVVVIPSATGFRLFAQSVNTEIAKELCDVTEKIIKEEA